MIGMHMLRLRYGAVVFFGLLQIQAAFAPLGFDKITVPHILLFLPFELTPDDAPRSQLRRKVGNEKSKFR